MIAARMAVVTTAVCLVALASSSFSVVLAAPLDPTPKTYATCSPSENGGTTCWGNSTSDPDFFWLRPTVPVAAPPTGPFDATALDNLAVVVCALDTTGGCVDGEPVEQFTSSSMPVPSRLTVDEAREFYTLQWLTGTSRLDRGRFYRVSVVKARETVGTIDLQFVQNTPELATVDATRFIGVVRGQPLTLRFRIQHPTARTRVRINEVESNQGVPGDWIELYNSASVPVSLAGYLVSDNDDTHVLTLPEGTVIPALGYYVVEEAALRFGLGAADSARLFTPDGTVLVDSYSWSAHAPTTYGRCPNGAGEFQATTTVTKGAVNDCSITIRINEIESSGDARGNWVELFNIGPAPANLTGFVLRDNDDAHSYAVPPVVVPVGGYLVLDEATFGFAMDSADAVRLFRPDGSIADAFTWLTHATTTFGRCPDGIGSFTTTLGSTRGTANNCFVPVTTLHINEIESSNGVPGDWIELVNTGVTAIDLSGWRVLDNDDTHTAYVLPGGSSIAAGGYFVLEESAFGFGLGAADTVRLFDPTGALYESVAWTAHAATTYGRCPNGVGSFATTNASTKGAANNCVATVASVRINEVESDGGLPGDWVELYNLAPTPVDISGLIFRDNNDANGYTIPSGTSIAGGGYYVLEVADFGFGLGAADSARLFDTTGVLIDSLTWTAHAPTTYGRCPDGTGDFATTTSATKGSANACPGAASLWPGSADVQTVDGLNVFGGNLSGLAYEGSGSSTPGVIWGARNSPGSLFRLVWNGTIWTPDATNGWSAGKLLTYADGTGSPDAEGVTFDGTGSAGGLYVSTERDNNQSGVSRNSILRFDINAAGSTLAATHEWNLTADLPVVGPNLGIEGITWIPDVFLQSQGFIDERTGLAYDPNNYPNHGTGLFFVGVEANGMIYAYALDSTGGFNRIATISSGFPGVMDLRFDLETNDLWAVCDDGCSGQIAVLRISAATHRFAVARTFTRPSTMPNLNNEGFTIAPLSECVNDQRPAFWADDSETGGHALRRGTVVCTPVP